MNESFTRSLDRENGRFLSRETQLEMSEPPPRPPPKMPAGTRLEAWPAPDLDTYLALFHQVGDPWLWYGRLRQSPTEIRAYLAAATTQLLRLWVADAVGGFIELDRRIPGEVEIAYFGLTPSNQGLGLGGFLLRNALHRAWQGATRRVWLHTCTEDHPSALAIYQHMGFRPFAEKLEWIRDPRLDGLLPREAGPHVAIPE